MTDKWDFIKDLQEESSVDYCFTGDDFRIAYIYAPQRCFEILVGSFFGDATPCVHFENLSGSAEFSGPINTQAEIDSAMNWLNAQIATEKGIINSNMS